MIANLIGRILSNPKVHNRLLAIAMRNADMHITSPDGTDVYMYRYWLFNKITDHKRKYAFIPFSIRIHRIMREDRDRHLHDHPFKARRWIMSGWYDEIHLQGWHDDLERTPKWQYDVMAERHCEAGHTSTLDYERYHKITNVSPGGALTLFAFGDYKGMWGFRVRGEKIPYREYLDRFNEPAHVAPKRAWNIVRDGLYPNCVAVQHSDQTICTLCNLGWDTNDPERPPCKRALVLVKD